MTPLDTPDKSLTDKEKPVKLALYYTFESSAVRAIKMTAVQLQLNLQPKQDPQETNRKKLLRLNCHTVPPTFYDHSKGLCLWEPKAVMIYLVTMYAPGCSLYPNSPHLRAQIDQWLFFDSTKLERCFQQIWYEKYFFEREPTAESLHKKKEAFTYLDHQLKGKYWLVGDELTLADIAVLATISSYVIAGGVNIKRYENIRQWLKVMINSVKGFEKNEIGALEFKKFLHALT